METRRNIHLQMANKTKRIVTFDDGLTKRELVANKELAWAYKQSKLSNL
jgi:hypothetical protein